MFIQISLQDGVPIYRQIVSQVKYLVASGQLQPDEELPPIRALAKQLLVNPNTIASAYRELETDGVVYKRRGAGTYISDFKSTLARKTQRKILSDRADSLLTEARQLGFDFDAVLDLLRERQAELLKKTPEEKTNVGQCG